MATVPRVESTPSARYLPARATGGAALVLPPWVGRLLGPPIRRHAISDAGVHVTCDESTGWSLASATISEALDLSALDLQRKTIAAYQMVRRSIESSGAPYPVRFWNFIPDIHATMGDGIDRYMSFNAGRFAAFCDWFGGPNRFDQHVATATGIGHESRDVVIHVLAGREAGVHLHNPRQRRPYRYSRRYGPFPPCFARATLARGGPSDSWLVLVGGTASVLDETSVHLNDVSAQLDETLHNLCRLLETAVRALPAVRAPRDAAALLGCFRTLRVYYARDADESWLRTSVARRLSQVREVEFIRAAICRPELLVEIEGTAGF